MSETPAKYAKTSEFLPGWPPKIELLVRKYMISKAFDNSRKYDIFHPSAWGQCLRKVAYQYYNDKKKFLHLGPDDVDLRFERIYDNGHGVHARWQKYLAHSNFMRGLWECPRCGKVIGKGESLGVFSPYHTAENWECECGSRRELQYQELLVKSAPKYNFSGHVDAVIDLRGSKYAQGGDYDLFVVDFKSCKDSIYSGIRQAKQEHIIQVSIYMWILDIKGAVILYENKDTQQLKEMFLARDDALIDKIKEEALWMVEVLKNRKLPDKPSGLSPSKFPCRLCEFRKICYA